MASDRDAGLRTRPKPSSNRKRGRKFADAIDARRGAALPGEVLKALAEEWQAGDAQPSPAAADAPAQPAASDRPPALGGRRQRGGVKPRAASRTRPGPQEPGRERAPRVSDPSPHAQPWRPDRAARALLTGLVAYRAQLEHSRSWDAPALQRRRQDLVRLARSADLDAAMRATRDDERDRARREGGGGGRTRRSRDAEPQGATSSRADASPVESSEKTVSDDAARAPSDGGYRRGLQRELARLHREFDVNQAAKQATGPRDEGFGPRLDRDGIDRQMAGRLAELWWLMGEHDTWDAPELVGARHDLEELAQRAGCVQDLRRLLAFWKRDHVRALRPRRSQPADRQMLARYLRRWRLPADPTAKAAWPADRLARQLEALWWLLGEHDSWDAPDLARACGHLRRLGDNVGREADLEELLAAWKRHHDAGLRPRPVHPGARRSLAADLRRWREHDVVEPLMQYWWAMGRVPTKGYRWFSENAMAPAGDRPQAKLIERRGPPRRADGGRELSDSPWHLPELQRRRRHLRALARACGRVREVERLLVVWRERLEEGLRPRPDDREDREALSRALRQWKTRPESSP